MSEKDKVSAPRLWLVLARAYGSMVSYIEESITAQGLGISDFMVLEVLLHKGPMTISAIGEKVLLASASMTSAIDRLEKRELVRRRNCSSDRRIRIVELTDCGKAFIAEIFARHEKDLEAVTAGLSDEERQMMYEGLKKIGHAAKAAVSTAESKTKLQDASA
ncbi:MAG TPA: MarR family transcriptional regulator [Edaphobacter sp.]|jgi:MarR family 2-MHQ and catechol resistance regulon transcriptional repressor|nr:MarR family transcriptional regulator [Edaphobacter sp.]